MRGTGEPRIAWRGRSSRAVRWSCGRTDRTRASTTSSRGGPGNEAHVARSVRELEPLGELDLAAHGGALAVEGGGDGGVGQGAELRGAAAAGAGAPPTAGDRGDGVGGR